MRRLLLVLLLVMVVPSLAAAQQLTGTLKKIKDADFQLAVNRVLASLYRSGEIMEVFKRWFAAMGARPSPLLLALYTLHSLPE